MARMTWDRVVFRLWHHRKWTQAMIASELGMSQQNVSKICKNFKAKVERIAKESGGDVAETIREFIGA